MKLSELGESFSDISEIQHGMTELLKGFHCRVLKDSYKGYRRYVDLAGDYIGSVSYKLKNIFIIFFVINAVSLFTC